jgi:hypothetical protein
MPTALANRFVHLEFEINLDDWCDWALEAGIKTEIVYFMRYRPKLLMAFDPKSNKKAFPSPRSWEFASNVLKSNPPTEIEFELLKGTVGEGAAAEVTAFLQIYRDLISPETVLMDPQNAPVPEKPASLYAMCGALARHASEQTIERLVTYFNRLPDEFSVLAMRDSVKHDSHIIDTVPYIKWAKTHRHVLI